jgi:hypothetical protein
MTADAGGPCGRRRNHHNGPIAGIIAIVNVLFLFYYVVKGHFP